MVAEPFWQKAILEAIGPVVGAVVGTLIIGSFASSITQKAQHRREDRALQLRLVERMTRIASALYLETQHYWRERSSTDQNQILLRTRLDQRYHKSRVAGEVLESQLRAFFEDDAPRQKWHAIMDLLTVRYFQVLSRPIDNLVQINAGPNHSGLSADELKQPQRVLDAYRSGLLELGRNQIDMPVVLKRCARI